MNKKIMLAGAATLALALAAATYVARTRQTPASPPNREQAHAQAGTIVFPPDAPQLSSLKVSSVVAAPLPSSDPVNGRIAYDEDLTARVSSPIAGRVMALRAAVGDRVHNGVVLAVIDAPDLAAADADWRKAQADAVRKRMAIERAQALFQGEVLALKDVEAAQADYDQAKAEMSRAALRMRNLHATGNEQGTYGLRAPINGVVSERQINPGQEVRPDLAAPLFVISDLRHLWIIVDVPERSAGALRSGQLVALESDAEPGQRFEARIERVGMTLDPVTRRVQVRCALFDPAMRLKPEMFVRVSFLSENGTRNAIAVPNASLFSEGLYDYVFVERAPGSFVRRRVGVALRGHDVSFLGSGVASGERVVTEGAFLLNAEVAEHAQ